MPQDMRRIEGHICQPLVEWIRSTTEEMPKGWGGKERCLPAKQDQVNLMQEQMIRIHRHIRRRVLSNMAKQNKRAKADWAVEGWEDGIEAAIREDRWNQLWEKWAESRPAAMEERSLLRFKNEFRRLVVCHVDKHSSEGMLI